MSVLQSTIFKLSGYYHCKHIARFSISSLLNKQTLEEKLGLQPRPKKPITPFLRFVNGIRPELLQQKPDIKITEVVKIAAERWKHCDEHKKNELKKLYEKDLLKYQEDIKEYDLTLSPDSRDKVLLEKEYMKQRKEKNQLRKRREVLGCPKKPPTSFLIFMKEKVPERGNVSYSEWLSKVSKDWNQLSADERAHYTELHKKELIEYKKKMTKWEKDMIAQGLESVLKH